MSPAKSSSKKKGNIAQKNRDKYRILFEESPISLWEEDFSEVKQFFDKLREQGVKDFKTYFEKNPDAVKTCAAKVKVLDVNQVTLQMYKAKSKEDLLTNLSSYFIDSSFDVFREELVLLASGKRKHHTETKNRTQTGEIIDVYISLSVPPGFEETLSRVFISIIDITEQKKAERKQKEIQKELRKQKEELSDFAHYMVHDLTNTLNTTQGLIKLQEKEFNEFYSESIVKQFNHMRNLLNRSIALANAGLIIEKRKQVNLNDLIDEIAKISIPDTITWTHEILPVVNCDYEKIFQVFKNLFENAVVHAHPNKIEVTCQDEDRNYVINVINDGEILSSDKVEHIFKRGYSTRGSTGLGLTIVEKIIKAHGWIIKVETTPDITMFQIVIPKT